MARAPALVHHPGMLAIALAVHIATSPCTFALFGACTTP
jgi:hypothetical protein